MSVAPAMGTGDTFARPPSEQSRAQAHQTRRHTRARHAVAGVACMQWRALKGSRGCKCKASRFTCLRACQTSQRGADARMRTRVLRAGNNNGCSGVRGTLHAKEYTSARWWGGRGAVRRACCAHRECTRDSHTVAAVGAPALANQVPKARIRASRNSPFYLPLTT